MNDDFELVRGSGNIYRDFGHENAGLEQVRVLVAAEIIRNLDARNLSTREAPDRPASPIPSFPASATRNCADLR